MSNKSKSETTTNMGPWQPQQDDINNLLDKSTDWFNNQASKNTFFPGNTVAGFNQTQQNALGGIENLAAGGGSGLIPMAQQQNAATLRGDFLNAGNPYMQQVAQANAASIAPSIDAHFGAAGRFGSPAHAGALGTALANANAPFQYAQYQNERDAQQKAALAAPGLNEAGYQNLNTLLAAGGTRQQQQQAEIGDQVARYDYDRDLAYNNLAKYHDLIGGSYGQSGTTSTTSSSGNPWMTGAGLILGGLNTANQMYSSGGMMGGGRTGAPTLGSQQGFNPAQYQMLMAGLR